MNTCKYFYIRIYRQVALIALLCSLYALPSQAFTPVDTVTWKKNVQKFAKNNSSVNKIVNYLNSKKPFLPPQTLPLGSEYTFETDSVHYLRATRVNDSVFVMVYNAMPAMDVTAMAGKINSAGVISFGAAITINTLSAVSSNNLDVAALDDTTFIVVSDEGLSSNNEYFAVAGTVDGEGTITINPAGNQVAIPTADPNTFALDELRVAALSSTRCLITYTQFGGTQEGYAIVADISGVSISFPQSPVVFSSNTTFGISLDDFSSTQAIISYNDGGTSIKNVVANIDGAGNITYGTPLTIYSSAGAGKTDVAVTHNNAYLNIYEDNGSDVRIIKNTISGDVITKGTSDVVVRAGSAVNSMSIDYMTTTNAIVMVQDDRTYLYQIEAVGANPVIRYTNDFASNVSDPKEASFAVGMKEYKLVAIANTGGFGEGGVYAGDVTPPQLMKVFGNDVHIPDAAGAPNVTDGTRFDTTFAGAGSVTQVFTIKNEGSGTLNLVGNPIVGFSMPTSEFSIIAQPGTTNLEPGATTTFTVEFAPTSVGTHNPVIFIETDDPATGAGLIYNFAIKGEGIQAPGVIAVVGNSNYIIPFPDKPVSSVTDSTSFGTVPTGSFHEVSYLIDNEGAGVLNVGTITSDNADFTIAQQVAGGVVNPGSPVMIRVRYSPSKEGAASAIISIPSNDPDIPVFDFIVEGTGIQILTTPVFATPSSTQTEVFLDWTDNDSTEVGFEIYRALPAGPAMPPNPPTPGPYQLIHTTQPNVTSFVDIGLSSNSPYIYRIRAIATDTANNSLYSDTVIVMTQGNLPTSPSSLNALTLSQTEIQLEWQDNSTNETGFEIYRAADGDVNFSLINTLSSNQDFYIDEGLESKTKYYYIIRATGSDGPSPPSDTVNATTLSNAPDDPSELIVTSVSGSELQLEWLDNSDNEIGFIIRRTTQQLGGNLVVIDTVANNIVTYLDTGLVDQTTYFYEVYAYNSDGLSDDGTNIASGITANVPLVPSNVRFSSLSPTSMQVFWDIDDPPSSSRNASGFKIEAANLLGISSSGQRRTLPPETFANGRKVARTTDNLLFTQVGTVDATTTSFIATGLTANQKYTFRVRAYNDNGNSPYTADTSVTTNVDPSYSVPNAPTNLKVSAVSQSELDLIWQDNSNNELIFKIERRRNGETTWSEIAQVIGGITSFSSTGLLADSTYYYRIRASNQGGESDYSNISSAKVECNLVVLVTNNSGDNTICSGKASLLVVNTNVTDAKFQWKQNGLNIENANLPVFTATETGEYNCQVIAGDCSKSSTSPVVVIVKSSFQVSVSIPDTTTNQIVASVSGAQNYQWYHDYKPITDATGSKYTPARDGAYFVVVSNEGCSSTSNLLYVTLNATGVEDTRFANSIVLSPNPASHRTVLTMTNEDFGRYKILITDIKGKVQQVLEGTKNSKTLEVSLPVQNLAAGMHLVKVRMKKKEGVKKLLKK